MMLVETSLATLTSEPAPRLLPRESRREQFARLRSEYPQLAEAGHLDRAKEKVDEALALARQLDDRALIDLTLCDRAALAIWTGSYDDQVQDLRVILMRNSCAEAAFKAAYNLSMAYEFKGQNKKALFYARVARDRSLAADRDDYLAKSHNQIGQGLMAESYFDDALEEFDHALALLPQTMDVMRAALIVNQAYCHMVRGRYQRAFGPLFGSLRWCRRNGKRLLEVWPHLMLCFGYLELGRLRHAWRHGQQALTIAYETKNYNEALKPTLFLLAEVEKTAGDYPAAHDYLNELQYRFYPDQPQIPARAAAVGMRQLVNLRA